MSPWRFVKLLQCTCTHSYIATTLPLHTTCIALFLFFVLHYQQYYICFLTESPGLEKVNDSLEGYCGLEKVNGINAVLKESLSACINLILIRPVDKTNSFLSQSKVLLCRSREWKCTRTQSGFGLGTYVLVRRLSTR